MKKKVMGYMTIGLLAVTMMVQAQPASRPGRNLNLRDSSERIAPMNRMGAMGGPRMGVVRPGQFGQRDSVRAQAPMRRMQPSRELQRGTRQMPQGRNGMAPFGGRPMQRGGDVAAPGNRMGAMGGSRGMQRGGMAPGFGMQRGLQSGRGVDPEKRIENEVEQLKRSLDLSSDQVKKITDLKKKQAKKEIKAYKKSQKKLEARRKKVQAPTDEIKSVLTEEQIKMFESSRSKLRISGNRNQQ